MSTPDGSELINPEPESIDLSDLLPDGQSDEASYAYFDDSNSNNHHHYRHPDYDNDNDDNPQAAAGGGGGGGEHSPIRHAIGQHQRRFSRVDTPLRVEPPPSFNAPARPADQTTEQQIKVNGRLFLSY